MCDNCNKIKELINTWVNKTGHHKCWYYPDIFKEIAETLNISIEQTPTVKLEDFRNGCYAYTCDLYKTT